MARVRLGRNKQDYPLTGYWRKSKVSSDKRRIDYKQVQDEMLDLDNFGSRQVLSGTIVIETETPLRYLVKDVITLCNGTEYIIKNIAYHYQERQSKEITSYLKPRVKYFTLTLGRE